MPHLKLTLPAMTLLGFLGGPRTIASIFLIDNTTLQYWGLLEAC